MRIDVVNLKDGNYRNCSWNMKLFSPKTVPKKDMQLKVESDGTSVHTCSEIKDAFH